MQSESESCSVKTLALGRSNSLKNQLPFSKEKCWIGISPANKKKTHETLSVCQKKSLPLRLNLHIIKFPIFSIYSFFSLNICIHGKMKLLVVPSRPTLCNPMDYSPPGSAVRRILECIVIPFSRGSSQPRYQQEPPALYVDSSPSEPLGRFCNAKLAKD